MNYDDHEDFNKARTPEEATKEFADAREAMYDKANADFSGGTKLGLIWTAIIGLVSLFFFGVTA